MNITSKTKTLGIFGYPISHTLSPAMHNAVIKALGLDMVYLPFEVKPSNLKEAINGIKSLGIIGVNITIPHKESVIRFLDDISEEARLVGAVNTIVYKDRKLVGYNTDGSGYMASLKEELGFKVDVVSLTHAWVYKIRKSKDESSGVFVLSYLCVLLSKTGVFEIKSEAGKAEFNNFHVTKIKGLHMPQFYKVAIRLGWRQLLQDRHKT